MIDAPSSTFFTQAPHWQWLIVCYFFFGGLAGGSYFLAALIDFLGRPEDRPLARTGYLISFPCVVISGILLIIDLSRPERFWHMLIESNTFEPMFKAYSPMSVGAWALLIFGLFSFVSFVGALADADKISWSGARRFRRPGLFGAVWSSIGALFGFYIAGYTGVLLAVTNRPIWSDTPLLGFLFIVSAASISAALIILLAERSRWTMPGLFALRRLDALIIALELIVLIAFLISLGPVFRSWISGWGLLLLLGVIIAGLLVPLALHWRERHVVYLNLNMNALLVLLGGFLLRVVIVFVSEGISL
jgi:formate-dependent nitrite reductase membrane component NrfD